MMVKRECSARRAALGVQLDLMGQQLCLCHAAVVVAAGALEAQNVRHDAAVARVLRWNVGDRLDELLGTVQELATQLKHATEGEGHDAHCG